MVSSLVALPTFLTSGKSALLLLGGSVAEDGTNELVEHAVGAGGTDEPEEEAAAEPPKGNPNEDAEDPSNDPPTKQAPTPKDPPPEDAVTGMEDEEDEIVDFRFLEDPCSAIPNALLTAVLLPFPLSAAVLAAGPRFAKSDPLCAKRPAHIHWEGGWAFTSLWKTTKPKIPAPTKILPYASSARLV